MPPSGASPVRSASRASVPARRPAGCSRPGSAPSRPGPMRSSDALPEYYSEAVQEHEVDVIAPPEIDITAGEESGDGRVRRGGRGPAPDQPRRLRLAARHHRPTRGRPRRRSTSRSTGSASNFAELETVDRPAHRRRQRQHRHRRHPGRRAAAPASPPRTTSTRSAAAPSCPSSTRTCAGAKPGDILAVHRRPSRSRRGARSTSASWSRR